VRAVIAESFERIHRSNLVGMGVLPLQFKDGQNARSLGLTGRELFDIHIDDGSLGPRQEVTVIARPSLATEAARSDAGQTITFTTLSRIDTPIEVEYYRHGGILPYVLRKLLKE
jgi:aconitate hydratase